MSKKILDTQGGGNNSRRASPFFMSLGDTLVDDVDMRLSQLAQLRGMHPDIIRRMIDNVCFIADHFRAQQKHDKVILKIKLTFLDFRKLVICSNGFGSFIINCLFKCEYCRVNSYINAITIVNRYSESVECDIANVSIKWGYIRI